MPNKILIFIVLALSFGMNGCVVTSKTWSMEEVFSGLQPVQESYYFDHDGTPEASMVIRNWMGPLAEFISQSTLRDLHHAFEIAPQNKVRVSMSEYYSGVTIATVQEEVENHSTLIMYYKPVDLWGPKRGIIAWPLCAEEIRPGHWVPVILPTERLQVILAGQK